MTHEQAEKRAIAATLFNNTDRYADIMRLPHHESTRHPQMPNGERAAQFAPFAALTGYHELLAQSSQRLAQQSRLPFEEDQVLQQHLRDLARVVRTKPKVSLTYFDPETGETRTLETRVVGVDSATQQVTLVNQAVLPFEVLQAVTLLTSK